MDRFSNLRFQTPTPNTQSHLMDKGVGKKSAQVFKIKMKNVPSKQTKDVSISVIEEAQKMKKDKKDLEYDELVNNMQQLRSNREFLNKRNTKTEVKIKEKDDADKAS